MLPREFPASEKPRFAWLLLVALFVLAIWLRLDTNPKIYSIDELWTSFALDHMQASGTLDNNYRYTYNKHWPNDDYNLYLNSSHYAGLYLWEKLLPPQEKNRLIHMRAFNLILETFSLLLLFDLCRRLFGWQHGLIALAFAGTLPPLVQDAHIARSEPFINFFVMAFLYSLSAIKQQRIASVLSGVCAGVASASKINVAPITILAWLGYQLFFSREPLSRKAWCGILFGTGFFLGFFATAPYAIINWEKYILGVQLLFYQYDLSAIPTGYIDNSLLSHINRISLSYLVVFGPLFCLFAIIGCFPGQKPAAFKSTLVFLVGLSLLSVVLQNQYWIRNISHIHLPLCILAACGFLKLMGGQKRGWFGLVLLLTIAPLLYYSITMKTDSFPNLWSNNEKLSAIDASIEAKGMHLVTIEGKDIYKLKIPEKMPATVYKMQSINSDWNILFSNRMTDHGFRIHEITGTPYQYMPVNDFTAMFSAKYIYFY